MKSSPKLVIGFAGALISLGGFFFFMEYFGLFNSVILYRDAIYMTKLIFAQSFIAFALFSVVSAVVGYRIGLAAAGVIIGFLGFAYMMGLLVH